MKNALAYLFLLLATNSSAATIGPISPAQISSNDQINITLFLPDNCSTSVTAESPIIDFNNRIIRFNVVQLPIPVVCAQVITPTTKTFGPLSSGNYTIQVYRDNILRDSREITIVNANPIPTLNIYGIILLSVVIAGFARKKHG